MPRRQKIRFLGMQGRSEMKFTSDKRTTSKYAPNIMLDLFGRKGVEVKSKSGGSWGLGKLLKFGRKK